MQSLQDQYTAVVVGASGGIGSAILGLLKSDNRCLNAIAVDRTAFPEFDLRNEGSIEAIACDLSKRLVALDLIIIATGTLQPNGSLPEKSIAKMQADDMVEAFRINAVGPALLIKHLSPLLPSKSKGVIAVLSARVGSIADNRLGGWISYRSSKAALNQIIRTSAIELKRTKSLALCVALHPGTVDTRLSRSFGGSKEKLSPLQSGTALLQVIDELSPDQSGTFYDVNGKPVDW